LPCPLAAKKKKPLRLRPRLLKLLPRPLLRLRLRLLRPLTLLPRPLRLPRPLTLLPRLLRLPLRPKKRSSNSCFALNAQKADLRVGFFYADCVARHLMPAASG
jgi:hypothetical protein